MKSVGGATSTPRSVLFCLTSSQTSPSEGISYPEIFSTLLYSGLRFQGRRLPWNNLPPRLGLWCPLSPLYHVCAIFSSNTSPRPNWALSSKRFRSASTRPELGISCKFSNRQQPSQGIILFSMSGSLCSDYSNFCRTLESSVQGQTNPPQSILAPATTCAQAHGMHLL